jgi:hypothetical protein
MWTVYTGFVVEKVTPGQVSVEVNRFSHAIIILPVLHTHASSIAEAT